MHYSQIQAVLTSVFTTSPQRAVHVEGPPGVGKTSLTYDVAASLGIPADHVVIFRPSLRDPVDLMGVPSVDREKNRTQWNPPTELAKLQEGDWLLCIDELPQAPVMMQNALAGLMLDRFLGDLTMSPGVRIMSTGNRTKDKAGANRVVSQLGNRVMRVEMEVNNDDWQRWALATGLDTMLIAFLRFKANLLLDFDPDRFSNPTPRSWEYAADLDTNMAGDLYYGALSGVVGEGAAAEYIGFRRLVGKLPSIDTIMLNPDTAEVPDEPEVRYALVATLTTKSTKINFSGLLKYINRLPVDFQVLYMKAVTQQEPGVLTCKEFVQWASNNADVFK